MKILTGGFFHESNTFNPILTSKEDFIVFDKEEIYLNCDKYLMAKGIIDFFKNKPDTILVPTLFAKAVPNGVIDYDYYSLLKEKFLKILETCSEIDGIILALHGSMRVDKVGDAEGDILECVRSIFPKVPTVCSLDMHATITAKMIKNCNGFIGFKTAPHVDAVETGYQVAEILYRSLTEKFKLTYAVKHLPVMLAGEKSETDVDPMKSLISELNSYEKEDDILAASYLLGFPWADSAENGVTSLVVTKNNFALAQTTADKLAEKFWQKRYDFKFSVPAFPATKALEKALKSDRKLTFLSDSGDNPTAGSTGDNTELLTLLNSDKTNHYLQQNSKKIIYGGFYDKNAVKMCLNHFGEELTIAIGGKFDKSIAPVILTGKVKEIKRSWSAYSCDLVLFQTPFFEVILASKHIGFISPDIFEALNVDYLNYDLIIVKLGYLTDSFKKIASKSILALTKGCTNEVLRELDYSLIEKEKYFFT